MEKEQPGPQGENQGSIVSQSQEKMFPGVGGRKPFKSEIEKEIKDVPWVWQQRDYLVTFQE